MAVVDQYGNEANVIVLAGGLSGPEGQPGVVQSVNGYSQATVVLTKADIGLSNVDNTSDLNKPISNATQTALNLKANDADVVHDTGTETIAGVKTFSSSPIVPTPTTDFQPATKAYADSVRDDAIAFAIALGGA